MALSPEQVEQYFEQGFLVLAGLVEDACLQACNERFLALVEGREALPPGVKIMQDVMVVKGAVTPPDAVHGVNKILCLEEDETLFAFARQPQLLDALASLLGDELYSLSSNVFNKPPGVDARHPLHQDLRYFKLEPADKIVGVWTAITPATDETGCLEVVPGSHKGGLLEHALPDWEFVNHGFYGVLQPEQYQVRKVELQPGETLLFHPLLIHGSDTNHGDQCRRAISIHVAAGDCRSTNDSDWRSNRFTRRLR